MTTATINNNNNNNNTNANNANINGTNNTTADKDDAAGDDVSMTTSMEPDASALAILPLPSSTIPASIEQAPYLRIGQPKYNYYYSRRDDGPGLHYECERGSDHAVRDGNGKRLHLVIQNGRLTAVDAPMGCTRNCAVTSAFPIFDTDRDGLDAGWHTWRVNKNYYGQPDWSEWTLTCETTHLPRSLAPPPPMQMLAAG